MSCSAAVVSLPAHDSTLQDLTRLWLAVSDSFLLDRLGTGRSQRVS